MMQSMERCCTEMGKTGKHLTRIPVMGEFRMPVLEKLHICLVLPDFLPMLRM